MTDFDFAYNIERAEAPSVINWLRTGTTRRLKCFRPNGMATWERAINEIENRRYAVDHLNNRIYEDGECILSA